jgi:hypothetical protein
LKLAIIDLVSQARYACKQRLEALHKRLRLTVVVQVRLHYLL